MDKNFIIRKLDLPKEDWKSVLKSLGVVVIGTVLTFASQHLANVDFGQYTYLVIPIVTVAVNILRKVFFNNVTLNVIGLDEKNADKTV